MANLITFLDLMKFVFVWMIILGFEYDSLVSKPFIFLVSSYYLLLFYVESSVLGLC